jgi:hypothetical protein
MINLLQKDYAFHPLQRISGADVGQCCADVSCAARILDCVG